MNKMEIVSAVSSETGLSHKDTAQTLDAFLDIVKSTLKSGDKVQLVGFGSWEARVRKARVCTNPKTGGKVQVPERRAVHFSPGQALKATVG